MSIKCRKSCKDCNQTSQDEIFGKGTRERGDHFDYSSSTNHCRHRRCLHSVEDENSVQQQKVESEEGQKQEEVEEAQKQKEAEESQEQKAAEEAQKQKAAEEAQKQKEAEEAQKQKEAEEAQKQKAAEEARKQKEEFEAQQKDLEQNIIPKLQERCKKYPSWTRLQVERCLSFAEDGIEYDPVIFDLSDSDVKEIAQFDIESGNYSKIALPSKLVVLIFALLSAYLWRSRRKISRFFSKKKHTHVTHKLAGR